MKPENFKSQDVSTRNTFPLTLISILIASGFYIGAGNLLEGSAKVDIRETDADIQVEASEMSKLYYENEEEYHKKFDNKVLEVKGFLSNPPGEDLETKTVFIELAGAQGDNFGIQCYFEEQNSGEVKNLTKGDAVTVKGQCTGNGKVLSNCTLIDTK